MTSLDSVLKALDSPDPNMRQRAAMALGTLDAGAAMPLLVPALASEPDAFVRETLTWAVVANPEAATPHLVAALGRDDLPHEPVLHALSKIGDPSTVPAIMLFADDPDPLVAAKAWWALARIGRPEALPAMLAHLGASDAGLRHGLTRALLQFGPDAIEPLGERLSSDDAAVRSHAAEVLVAFSDPSRHGTFQREAGQRAADRAAAVLRTATAPEVDGALLLATVSDDRASLVEAANKLRDERA